MKHARAARFTSFAFLALLNAHVLRGADCNRNGVDDPEDIATAASADCNQNGVPDECDLIPSGFAYDPLGVTLKAGTGALEIRTADLDRDGDLDLAVSDYGADQVLVRFNQGNGTFPSSKPHPVGGIPYGLAAGDLDGDDSIDLATGNNQPSISVLLNKGDGDFQPSSQIPLEIGEKVFGLEVGDLDGDGDLDLVGVGGASSVWLFTNSGDAQFTRKFLPTGPAPTLVRVADLDADGHLDIATANNFGERGVWWFWNQGGGRFGIGQSINVGGPARGIVTADFDRDGDVDLMGTGDYTNSIWSLTNVSKRHFSGENLSIGPSLLQNAADGDVNGDGDPDLVVMGPPPSSLLAVLVNQGNGSFGLPIKLNAGVDVASAVIADLDGDHDADLAAANYESNNMSLFFNKSAQPLSADCDSNGVPDQCDIAAGLPDANANGVPDECEGGLQRPGDASQDGSVDVSDAIWIFGHLFLGTNPGLPCEGGGAANPGAGDLTLIDVNGDGWIDLSDGIRLLGFLFLGTDPPTLGRECIRIVGCPEECVP